MSEDIGRAAVGGQILVNEAPAGLHPSRVWHLVCITRLGKVSMIRDLDLLTARETYKRLRPNEHPRVYVYSECECSQSSGGWGFGSVSYYGSSADNLETVSVIGPAGADVNELDPWSGVVSRIIDMTHMCRCGHRKAPEPMWDEARTDFWNDPKLWDGVDPVTQMCWQKERTDEHLHSDGPGGIGTQRRKRGDVDLGSCERPEGVAHKRRSASKADSGKQPKVATRRPPQSERAGA